MHTYFHTLHYAMLTTQTTISTLYLLFPLVFTLFSDNQLSETKLFWKDIHLKYINFKLYCNYMPLGFSLSPIF